MKFCQDWGCGYDMIYYLNQRWRVKKVLIAYYSLTGKTKAMAEYIAEGIRISGHDADVRKISEINNENDLKGYDAYIFGCPTYHRDMTDNMKAFLFVAKKADLAGRYGVHFLLKEHIMWTPIGYLLHE